MATTIKIPTLVHLVLPPKKLDSHVSIRLNNDDANFEEANFGGREEIDYYKLLDTHSIQTSEGI